MSETKRPYYVFSLECTCGEVSIVEADNQDEAVARFKASMTQATLNDHYRRYHGSADAPTLDVARAEIDRSLDDFLHSSGTWQSGVWQRRFTAHGRRADQVSNALVYSILGGVVSLVPASIIVLLTGAGWEGLLRIAGLTVAAWASLSALVWIVSLALIDSGLVALGLLNPNEDYDGARGQFYGGPLLSAFLLAFLGLLIAPSLAALVLGLAG